MSGRDNRDFFRISQDVLFDFHTVEGFAADNDPPEDKFDDGTSINLIKELNKVDKDSVKALKILSDKNRLLGDYLSSLSKKIDLIARHTLFAHESSGQEKPKTRINISEEGIAFIAPRALYKDSYVALRMVFLPEYIPVFVFAQIIRCDAKEEQYQIAAKFHKLVDSNRQLISRQILRAQRNKKNTV